MRCSSLPTPRIKKIVIRFARPPTTIIDGRDLSDMKLIAEILRTTTAEEYTHIVMAGTDNFTANAPSFARFFNAWKSETIVLAVANESWELYDVKQMVKICNSIIAKVSFEIDASDARILRLLHQWSNLAIYKNNKSAIKAPDPVEASLSLRRNIQPLPDEIIDRRTPRPVLFFCGCKYDWGPGGVQQMFCGLPRIKNDG